MKRWIVMAVTFTVASLLCVVPTVLLMAGYVQFRPTSEPAPPLRVSQRYGFQVSSGRYIAGKVLEPPQRGWVKVEVQEDGKSFTILLSLQEMRVIVENPPAEWIQNERWQVSSLRQALDIQVIAAVDNHRP